MSWFRSIMGRPKIRQRDEILSPEVTAIFDKFSRYLDDEDAQNDQLPDNLKAIVTSGANCDVLPGATGEFGRELGSPIPVNGSVGELIYLSNLLTHSGSILLFHRLRPIQALDVYEVVSADAKNWDVLFLDLYHPRKSRCAPRGYQIASASGRLFSGTNTFVQSFPKGLHEAIRATHKQFLGIELAPPEVKNDTETTVFVRPSAHAAKVKEILAATEPDVADALFRQTVGAQSVLYRLFRESLGYDDSGIRKLELTYFAASLLTYVYLRIGKERDRKEILDRYAKRVLESSILAAGEHITLSIAVADYQKRFGEYSSLLSLLFNPQKSETKNPELTLMLHVFECVTGASARRHMMQISMAAGLLGQFALDHAEFVKDL